MLSRAGSAAGELIVGEEMVVVGGQDASVGRATRREVLVESEFERSLGAGMR